MVELTEAVVDDDGLAANADRGGRRSVTLLEADGWARACERLGADLDPIARRANLLVSGIDLVDSRGRLLRIGEVEFEITSETTPCGLMDVVHVGLQDALRPEWRGGASTRVTSPGTIRVGDKITWLGSR